MKHPPPTDKLLTRLYLGAVLPSLATLVELDPESGRLTGQRPWSVQLRTPQGDTANLAFDGESLRTKPIRSMTPLTLRFHSEKHLIDTFTERSRLPPLPVGGFGQLIRVNRFTRLTTRLARVMNPNPETLDHRSRLLFGGLLTRALAVLCTHQPEAARSVSRFDDFYCQLSIRGEVSSWFGRQQGAFRAGSGTPADRPCLHIEFRNLDVATAAATGHLDHLAAVGSGQVTVTGLTPLADVVDVLLDRIDVYLR